ncbi:MAG: sigma-70 family RNA polymerase sigma factor [Clostridia bacterium]|nr:sigma-70 family RNA polymerase sigma factor [Clostridia bacterium]MBQ4607956.1 sigma-70 family RNA polymerase sigma factor [Clostridia bacterium]MBQ6858967.1 sigma-70 family RNA polymerase sigma factor [Clostridia bacterium]MBQ7053021.1 sigma-70 family RNA polymerase sigma factor [Clostridia bacterium]
MMEEMIARYGDDIFRLCLLYLGDRYLAEDAFQDTFVKAWMRRAQFRGECSEKTWLSRIAVNTCRDMLRSGWFRMIKRSRPIEQLFDLAAPEQPDDAPVRRAVLALPGKYREVIILYYDQGMKIREIAELLHLSANSTSTRLRRARALLKDMLGEEVDA